MLPADVKSLVDILKASPENEGVFQALLALLSGASDSTVIAEAFKDLQPQDAYSAENREKAYMLLQKAEADSIAEKWAPMAVAAENDDGASDDAGSNVVALKPRGAQSEDFAQEAQTLHVQEKLGRDVTFDDIGGLENVKSQIRRKIIKPFKNPSLFKKFKRRAGGGVLMYGPPGCGKTMMAQALANECDAQFIEARAADIIDKWQGVAEKKIVDIFAKARAKKPAVIFFDEVEALAMRRSADSTRGVNTIVSTLLNEMNGFSDENEGILFLGATNVPWSLDSAFRRPGRFDRTIFVPPPDRVAREFILKLLLKERPVEDDIDTAWIVEKSSGFSGADLEALVEAAVDFAIDESDGAESLKPLSSAHFKEAFMEVGSSTGEWLGLAQSYSEYANRDGLYDDLKAFLKKYA